MRQPLPSAPDQTPSGGVIKSAVVRAMQAQVSLERAASDALDKLLDIISMAAVSKRPPPSSSQNGAARK